MKQRLSRMIMQGMPLAFALLFAIFLPTNLMGASLLQDETQVVADDGTQPAAETQVASVETEKLAGETVSDTVRIVFTVSNAVIDTTLANNSESFARLRDWLAEFSKSNWKLETVSVLGAASPDGSVAINQKVSEARLNAMLNYIKENVPEFDSIGFTTKIGGRDWAGLYGLVAKDTSVPYRDEVLDLVREYKEKVKFGPDTESNLARLKALRSGVPYKYMLNNLFPVLRAGLIYITYTIPAPEPEPEPEPVAVPEPEPAPAPAPEPEPEPEPECTKCCGKNFYMNVQTNMLYDLALIPNIGAEFYLGKGWSIGGEWKYAFWEKKSKDWFWETYGGDLYVRKWFGKQAKAKPLTGHHLGILGQAVTYDYEEGGHRGVQADEHHWNWGASLEYGYSLPITRRLNLDFDIGLGYMGGKYYDYEDINGEFVWIDTKSKHWIGPTKLAVSLIWQIGCGNYNEGKKSSKKK